MDRGITRTPGLTGLMLILSTAGTLKISALTGQTLMVVTATPLKIYRYFPRKILQMRKVTRPRPAAP
jgi:hypothetical protein